MTGSIRLHVAATLAAGDAIAATAAQAHYLGTVMRRGPGDTVLLFNGRDGEFSARIETIRRDRASFRVEHRTRSQSAEPDLWLAFALLKRDATDLVVQKATELGVAALQPVITERSNTHRMNPDRLTAIAIEAAEQSERLTDTRAACAVAARGAAVRLAAGASPVRRRGAHCGAAHRPRGRSLRTAGRPGRRLHRGGA